MSTIVTSSANFSKKDCINSRAGLPLLDECNPRFTMNEVVACALMEKPDVETGEVKKVAIFKVREGDEFIYYSSISATIIEGLDDIIDCIEDEGSITLTIIKRKSKAGRDFLQAIIV